MELGEFSVSLAVKDLAASKAFYEKLGFREIPPEGACPENPPGTAWTILRNGEATIGLFQGMFEQNILTFNPKDIRALRDALAPSGIALELEAMQGEVQESGPAHAMLSDPDGNLILIDQF